MSPKEILCLFFIALGMIVIPAEADPAEIYDDFQSSHLDTARWSVELPKDKKLAAVKISNGDLQIYGNGGTAGVTSTKEWSLPQQGQTGWVEFTFNIRPWQRGKYKEFSLYDSRVLLVGQAGKDGKQQKTNSFGFIIDYEKYSDGNYMLLDGEKHKTQYPVTANPDTYNHIRIRLGRNGVKSFCYYSVSRNGKTWKVIRKSSPNLPTAVRIAFSSNWGHLAAGGVEVQQNPGSQKNENVAQHTMNSKPNRSTPMIPVMYSHKVSSEQRPRIDGNVTDSIWKILPPVELNHVAQSYPAPATQATKAWVCYDDENLYIAFSCDEDSMDKINTAIKTGGPIWGDDCVEVFIQPDPANRPGNVFHAAVNSAAQKVDESGLHEKWTCAANRWKRGWFVEMAIPFSILDKTPILNECWGINLNRHEGPHGENSTWAPIRSSFHDRDRFGRIVFGRPPVRIDGYAPVSKTNNEPAGLWLQLSADTSVTGDVLIASRWDQVDWDAKTIPADTRHVLLPQPASLTSGYHKSALKLETPGTEPLVIPGGKTFVDSGLPLASTFWPAEDYDNVAYLADGRMNMFFWLISDTRGGPGGYTATLETPTWVEIYPFEPGTYGALPEITEFKSETISRDGEDVRRTTIRTSSAPSSENLAKVKEHHAPFRIWWRATVPKGSKLPVKTRIRYWVSRNGMDEPAHEMPLVVLPRVNGTQPKRFPVFAWTNGPTYPRHLWKELADYYAGIGLNGLMNPPCNAEFEAVAKPRHLQMVGYCHGFPGSESYLKKHPDHAAVDNQGNRSKGLVCPEISLQENSDIFAQESSFLDTYCPSVGLNWDLEGPGVFDVCFCERCLAAFRKHAGLSADVPLTTEKILNDESLRAAWMDFALDQSKRMVIRWDKRISAARPGARLNVNGGQATNPRVKTDGRNDWRRLMPHIASAQMFRYVNSPQASATAFHTESVRSLAMIEDAAPTPVHAVLTTGYMRVTERMVFEYPELTTLQMVQMAAIGYKGIYYWHWYNNDGRFDNAIARGTKIIAKHEDFFLDGERLDVPADLIPDKPKYLLVLGRKFNGRAVLFLLNFDPDRPAEVSVAFDKLPGKTWRLADGNVEHKSKEIITIPPLDLVILIGN
ncbi:MAG: carbohydrate-binding family 9-like protein [Phycisphaerae bacterium]|nr:carbohydrate-binding family 9-like protein [Phycisphaerae bacterium]